MKLNKLFLALIIFVNIKSFDKSTITETDDFLLLSNIQKYNNAQERKAQSDYITDTITQELSKFKKEQAQQTAKTSQAEPSKEEIKTIIEESAPEKIIEEIEEVEPEQQNHFEDKELQDIKITVKAKPMNIDKLLEILSSISGLNIELDQTVSKATKCSDIYFKDTPVANVLKQVCIQNQPELSIIKDLNKWKLLTKQRADQIKKAQSKNKPVKKITKPHNPNVKYYKQRALNVKSANITEDFQKHAEKAWQAIAGKDANTMFAIDQETKKIFLRGTSSQIKEFQVFLDALDQPQVRVKIDIILALMDKTASYSFGIDWSGIYNRQASIISQKKNFGFVGLGGSLYDFPTPTSPVAPDTATQTYGNLYVDPTNFAINLFTSVIDAAAGFFNLPIVFGGPDLNTRRLNLLINMAEQETGTKILSKPSLLVTNNQVAKILIGESIPIYTNVQDVVQSVVRSLATINYKDVGISIQIKPTVSKDKKFVSLDIFLEASEIISGTTQVNSSGINQDPPVLLLVKIKDNIILENGQTSVIGGILQKRDSITVTKVPFLWKLPFVGQIFQGESKSHEDAENFIFITPTIIE
ncbi:hypothetical protein A3F66_03845 [candidate division TM6 bacterium RIFCSPHIGHO2_12_FULL_32_22]|nr:MAG: hypothetical protein A3F66_03845 [candidate division TM6 bacterium RIFCSPHIGHO2_12_FULL_32_22]